MKKLLMIGFVFYMASNWAFSQNQETKSTPEQRAEMQNEWMSENLHLTEEQVPQIEDLNLEYAQKMEEVRNISGRINQLKKAKSLTEEKEKELRKILTEGQFDIYQDQKKELRSQAKEQFAKNNR